MARKKDYGSVDMKLTDAQLRKLVKGQGIIVKPAMFSKGHSFRVSPAQHRRMMTAMRKGKGYTLKMSPEELEANEVDMEGGRINWRAIGRTLRRGAQKAAKFYREEVRPEIGPGLKRVVKKAIETGIPALATAGLTAIGQPEIAAAVAPRVSRFAEKVAEPGAEKLGKLTGAFGLRMKSTGRGLKEEIEEMEYPDILPYKAELQDNYSLFLGPNSPAMHPTLKMPDNSLPILKDPHAKRRMYSKGRGLSMMSYGGSGLRMMSGMGGSFSPGLPMEPALPQPDNSMMR
jgi:hypothetical protein